MFGLLDEKNFKYNGFQCKIRKIENPMKKHEGMATTLNIKKDHYLTGYVGLTKESPLFGLDLNRFEDIECHGGITYAGLLDDNKDIWWVGLDTNHLYDLNNPKDEDYVIENIELITDQLKEMESPAN